MDEERKYVIVCNRYKWIGGALLFWGSKTEDNKERSFGGYTNDFNKCEKYTLDEVNTGGYNFPVYGRNINHDNYRTVDDFVIEISRLKSLGNKPMLIYYR